MTVLSLVDSRDEELTEVSTHELVDERHADLQAISLSTLVAHLAHPGAQSARTEKAAPREGVATAGDHEARSRSGVDEQGALEVFRGCATGENVPCPQVSTSRNGDSSTI